jgi:hypothetical protein
MRCRWLPHIWFANNTTLRDLNINRWRDLAPALTALKTTRLAAEDPFQWSVAGIFRSPPESLCGLEVLLRSQDSKVKELVIEKVNTRTVGMHPKSGSWDVIPHLHQFDHSYSTLNHENIQQLQSCATSKYSTTAS